MTRPAPVTLVDGRIARKRPIDREPISTLENAVFRLVGMYYDENVSAAEYSMARYILSDVFWLTEKSLDDLVQREVNTLYPTNRVSRAPAWGQL